MDGSQLIVVKVAFDPEAGVWYVDHSSLAGLSGEAPTLEGLTERLEGLICDLLEEHGMAEGVEYPVEIIASRSLRVRRAVFA